jgi:apolipoprotein N-acyltransferase
MQIFAVLASAFIMWLAFPPVDWGILIFVGPAPLLWAMRRVSTAREAGWLGFLFGFVFWGGMLSWIRILGVVAWIPLAVVMGLFTTGWALVMYYGRYWSMWRWWILAMGSWSLMEFLRARIPFGGFPWGAVGYPVGDLAWPRSSAQWIGASGWAVIVIGFAAAVVLMFDRDSDRRPLELTVAVIITFSFLGAVFSPDANGEAVRVAVVQGNSPCPRIHCENEKARIYGAHITITNTIPDGSADLVVWGEDSFGGAFNPTFNGDVRREIGAEAVRIGAYLLAGGTRPGAPGSFDNYNVLFDPTGEVIGEYLKQHPVPFGEFVPFRRVLEFVPQLAQVPNDMRRGDGPVVFPLEVGSTRGLLGSVISFEGAFARYMRAEVKAGAQLLVVATNEGSYGESPASDQLIGLVRMSAVSLGVDVVHVAVTGKSTIIRANGSIGKTTELFTRDLLTGVVNFQAAPRTLYAVLGDWVQLLMIFGALGVAVATIAGRSSRDFSIRPGVRR